MSFLTCTRLDVVEYCAGNVEVIGLNPIEG